MCVWSANSIFQDFFTYIIKSLLCYSTLNEVVISLLSKNFSHAPENSRSAHGQYQVLIRGTGRHQKISVSASEWLDRCKNLFLNSGNVMLGC